MLKIETLQDLETAFKENELSELMPELSGTVETINLDLIRVHINSTGHPENIVTFIAAILHRNGETGTLNIHVETATSCNFIYYVDISSI